MNYEDYEDYDVGIINDYGGGDVGWWQDYIRAEVNQANEFWRKQIEVNLANEFSRTLKNGVNAESA